MKRVALLLVAVALLATVSVTANAAKTLRVALVAADRIGDRNFMDSAREGLLKAAKDFKIQYKILECKADASVYYDRVLAAAENFDLVLIAPGYFFDKELAEITPRFPKVTFVYLDGATDLDGLVSIPFAENEGSFLAGLWQGLMANHPSLKRVERSNVVGFVGGADWPVIRNFQVGYEQGVKYVSPKTRVESVFAGTHFDPAKGKEAALEVHKKGANIIYQAAGPSGLGVLEAARDADFWAIGVDIDQCPAQPGFIMASMQKKANVAVYETIRRGVQGTLKRGTTYPYGVKENGVGLCNCEFMHDAVPQDVIDQIADIARKIVSGEIVVKQYVTSSN